MNNDALNSQNKSNQDNNALFSIVNELQQILDYANKNLIKKQKEKNEEINLDEENLEEDEIEEKFSVYNRGGLGEKAQKKETGLLGKKRKKSEIINEIENEEENKINNKVGRKSNTRKCKENSDIQNKMKKLKSKIKNYEKKGIEVVKKLKQVIIKIHKKAKMNDISSLQNIKLHEI